MEKKDSEKCPTCGTISYKFDPPLFFDAQEACGQTKPGNYTSNGPPIPQCLNAKNHPEDEMHYDILEYMVYWGNDGRVIYG